MSIAVVVPTGSDDLEPFTKVKKSFFKRTRKGHIVRLVHDKYLRSDIECGYLLGRVLSQHQLQKIISEAPHQQLLVIDTNIALHQIDILEHQCPATSLVVMNQVLLRIR